jgi:hypothetical protein
MTGRERDHDRERSRVGVKNSSGRSDDRAKAPITGRTGRVAAQTPQVERPFESGAAGALTVRMHDDRARERDVKRSAPKVEQATTIGTHPDAYPWRSS